MSNLVGLDLNIDKNYLAEAVKQTVIIGIAEALNGKNEIVSQVVKSVLETRVDEKGLISTYKDYNKYSLIEYYVKNLITQEVKETITEMVNEQKEDIKKIIKEAIKKRKFTDQVVEAVMNGMVSQISNDYNTKIEVSLSKKERY